MESIQQSSFSKINFSRISTQTQFEFWMKKKLEEKDLTSFYTHRHHIIDLTRILKKIIHASYQSTMFEKVWIKVNI